jgi:flagellar basal-body rod modification protein FlgD
MVSMDAVTNRLAATDNDSGSDKTKTEKPDSVNKEMFLQLLVAQIKNQNPLNPADGTQFLTQLAQFSQLEQTIAIRQDLETLTNNIPPAADTSAEDKKA